MGPGIYDAASCNYEKIVKKDEIKENLDRSACKERRRCPSGTPGDARDAPTELFQQKYKNKLYKGSAPRAADAARYARAR